MTTRQIDISAIHERALAIWAHLHTLQDGGSPVKTSLGAIEKYLGLSGSSVTKHHRTIVDRGIVFVYQSGRDYLREVLAEPPQTAFEALRKILKEKKDREEREAKYYENWIKYRTEWAKANKAAIRRASHEVAKKFNDDLAEFKRSDFDSWWQHWGSDGITRYTVTEIRKLIESCIYDGYDTWDRVRDGDVLIPHLTQGGGLMVRVS